MTQTDMPQISFIVPIFNAEPYLVECIESILKQSVSKEIILIDDRSTDGSLEISQSFAKQHDCITLIHLATNHGQSHARNLGLDLAKGEWICFVDADDYLVNDYLAGLINTVNQDDNANNIPLIGYRAYRTYQDGSSVTFASSLPTYIKEPCFLDLDTVNHLSLLNAYGWMPGICWTLIRRTHIEKYNLRFLEGVRAEDQLFYLQLLLSDPKAKIAQFSGNLYHYRHTPDSTTTKAPNRQYFLDHLTICKEIQKLMPTTPMSSAQDIVITNVLKNIISRLALLALQMYTHLDQETQQSVMYECGELLILSNNGTLNPFVPNW